MGRPSSCPSTLPSEGSPVELDPKIAERIVSDLKDIIQHEINLFDTTGTIVASTDRSRIGTNHDGARLALSSRQTVSIDSDNQFRGAKHGINVPVLFNDSPVAVIGITGDRAEVEPFGNVIKKMTEILIRENWEQITRFDQRVHRSELINLLRMRKHDASLVDYLASVLEIDLGRTRRAVVGRMADAGPQATGEGIHGLLYSHFRQLPHSFFSVDGGELRMFVDEKDDRLLPQILRSVTDRLGDAVVFGVGNQVASANDYWKSYDEARRTADWLLFSHEGTVARWEDMDYAVFLSSIPSDEAGRFDQRVFGDLSDQEVEGFEEVFDAYTRHNGSIQHAADDLFLHKNTLQNRLNKIARKTGYNPRELTGYAVLSLAFKLRRYSRFLREA